MADNTPYRWQGNLYHASEVVILLTEIEPWKEWLDAGNTPGPDPEADLDSLAEFFGIDRADPDQTERRRFPLRASRASGFCSGCLNWFD